MKKYYCEGKNDYCEDECSEDCEHYNGEGGEVKEVAGEPEPKKNAIQEALINLRRQIHDHAIYPHGAGINPYISLRVVDAIIQDALKKAEVKV